LMGRVEDIHTLVKSAPNGVGRVQHPKTDGG
jgi:hypothetical protein